MSHQNLVSASLDPAVKTTILSQLTEIRKQLDFSVSLTPEAIKALPKAGTLLSPFVDKAASVVSNHPEILPGTFDQAEYKKDYQLMIDLEPISQLLSEIAEMVSNTLLAVKSDLFVASLSVYDNAAKQVDAVPGLNGTVAGMAEHFKRTKKTAAKPTAA